MPHTSLESLSTIALDVWRYGLTDTMANALVIHERMESETGASYEALAVSRALRELESAGWCRRCMFGFKRAAAHSAHAASSKLPL